MPVETEFDAELPGLEAWRLLCLLKAGYEQHRAELLAARTDIDLHLAVDLLEKKHCDQKLALKILL